MENIVLKYESDRKFLYPGSLYYVGGGLNQRVGIMKKSSKGSTKPDIDAFLKFMQRFNSGSINNVVFYTKDRSNEVGSWNPREGFSGFALTGK